MSEIQAWRFLVSRNQFLDYRTVVAPDFMCQSNIASLLAKTAEGDPINNDWAYYREIYGSKSGDLTIIYRISEAQAKDINADAEGALKDSFGREIYFIEGIVVKGIQASLAITVENLEFSHQKLVDEYREFWKWISPQPAIPSEAVSLLIEGNPLQYRQVTDYVVSPSRLNLEKFSQTSILKAAQPPSTLFRFNGEILLSRFIDDLSFLVHQYDMAVVRINLETDEKTILLEGGRNRYIRKAILNVNSNLVCTANVVSFDCNLLKILDLNSSTERDSRESSPSECGRVNALAFSCDNSVIAIFEKNNLSSLLTSSAAIKLVDTESGGIRGKELNWHTSDVKCIEPSPLDNIFASGDRKGYVKVWNWKSLQEVGSLQNHSSTVNAIAFSPNERILVSGGDDGKIKITNYRNAVEDQGLVGEHSAWEGVNTLAFSPDGRFVASGGEDGKVKLWDVKNKTQVDELSGHNKAVMSVSFSPNGKLLASGSKDYTVRIWQLS